MKYILQNYLVAALFLALAVPFSTAERIEAKTTKEHFLWADDSTGEEIHVSLVQDMNERGMIQIMLFDLPEDTRLILYSTMDAKSGTIRQRIEHDSSNWWIEYANDHHGTFDSMDKLFDHIFELRSPASETDKSITFSWESENFHYDQTYAYEPDEPELGGELRRRFDQSTIDNEKNKAFAQRIPGNIRQAIFYLSRFEKEVKYRYRETIDLLVHLLESAGFKSDLEKEEFVFERKGYEWGLGAMVTPEELEFTSRFESIDNADPLAGFRPGELFPEP